jgi:hypothetical protein
MFTFSKNYIFCQVGLSIAQTVNGKETKAEVKKRIYIN